LRYDINYPRNCIAQSNAARTLISFCMNLSSIVLVAIYATDAARLLCQMYNCFCFSFLSQGFPGMLEASRFPGRQGAFASQRGEEHLRRTLLLVWFTYRYRNGSEDGARNCRHVCQVWGAWGVQNGPFLARSLCTNRMPPLE
jgi:hypothetical protein